MKLLLPALLLLALPALAAPEYHWEKLEGCTLAESKWNDGDSFHAMHNGKEYIFRLYFVDTCEDAKDSRFPERLAEQAEYFGVSPKRAGEVGEMASEFTCDLLKKKPFTVWTLWRDAGGASKLRRQYAMVGVGDSWLSSLLVENGLARIYGKRIALPCGTSSRDYLALLKALEVAAKSEGAGGWGTAKGGVSRNGPSKQTAPESENQSSLDSLPVF